MKRNLKIIQLILIIGAVALGLWLVNINFPQSGQMAIKAIPGKDTAMLTRLGPDERIKIEGESQVVLDNPIYFELRSMPWFTRLRLKMVYQENGRVLEGIGGKIDAGWHYDVKKNFIITEAEAGFKQAVFDFDLRKIYQEKNVRRFIISTILAHGAEKGALNIKSLEMILSQ